MAVSTPVAVVTLPNEGLSEVAANGEIVTVAAERSGDTVMLTISADGKPIGSAHGGVALVVPVQGAAPGTVAVLVSEDGSRQVIRKSIADGNMLSVPLDGSSRIEIRDNGKTFTDVPDDKWSHDAVAFASGHELFNGVSKDSL